MGEGLRMLFAALSPIPHSDLVQMVTAAEISAYELLWQAKTLAFPVGSYRRERGVRAEVRAIGEERIRKFHGDHLVPVRDLLDSEIVKLPMLARKAIGQFIEDATMVRRHTSSA